MYFWQKFIAKDTITLWGSTHTTGEVVDVAMPKHWGPSDDIFEDGHLICNLGDEEYVYPAGYIEQVGEPLRSLDKPLRGVADKRGLEG